MSTPQNTRRLRGLDAQRLPEGETVASFATYSDALQAVDRLAKAELPVAGLSIVGDGLKSVERVTGALSYGKAAAGGALSGAWLGLFLGLMLIIINPATNLVYLGAAVAIGAAFGILFALVNYSISRRRRDFTSTMQVVASSYVIIAERGVGEQVRRALAADAGNTLERPAL
ncbi:general stress protein [Mycetocola reblochoni]|uniref:General stress protein 17M-like domain-containing protein n=1 Tax=Mycetocola reblochoni REB411 TaxID=1255698 RepID=A0A1R4J903_9MICO|nr:general stress protein [Mycetocola reblochoni]SJN28384.1 hypothetical protein FM119_05990 [Mycetocola reblochoni REB411]